MVPPAGKKARAAQLRYLNQPEPVRVRLNANGHPIAVFLGNEAHPVCRQRDRWRVDDTWWREPLSRMYYELELADGRIVTVYHDRIQNRWYQQRYGG
jgi:hypothetical protein